MSSNSTASNPPIRIFLRPVGSPLTIGMTGLAVASFVQSGLDLHWIATSQTLQVGLVLVTVPFILQLVSCVFSYLSRDGATGAAVGVMGATWLAMGLIHIVAAGPSRSGALGLLLFMAGGTLAMSALAIGTAKPLPGAVIGLAALRFVVAGIYQMGAVTAWQDTAGIIGLVVAGLASYAVLAFELEGQQHAPVLPTFRVGRGRDAVLADDPARRIDGVSNEAGVRQTS